MLAVNTIHMAGSLADTFVWAEWLPHTAIPLQSTNGRPIFSVSHIEFISAFAPGVRVRTRASEVRWCTLNAQ